MQFTNTIVKLALFLPFVGVALAAPVPADLTNVPAVVGETVSDLVADAAYTAGNTVSNAVGEVASVPVNALSTVLSDALGGILNGHVPRHETSDDSAVKVNLNVTTAVAEFLNAIINNTDDIDTNKFVSRINRFLPVSKVLNPIDNGAEPATDLKGRSDQTADSQVPVVPPEVTESVINFLVQGFSALGLIS